MSLSSRVALVTGAASGLGRATVERLSKQGARVVLLDLPDSKPGDILSDRVVFSPADVTSEEQVIIFI